MSKVIHGQFVYWFFSILSVTANFALAGEIKVAVAANFILPMNAIKEKFEANSNHRLTLISGSTGKHYAQIIHGAPYDVFFAADKKRPIELEKKQFTISDTRFTYAIGRILLWSPSAELIKDGPSIMYHDSIAHIAMANPKLAPYGRAAEQVLIKLGIKSKLNSKLVFGENINQTFQYVQSGSAELGIIAYSQVKRADQPIAGSYWLIPQNYHESIEQQAVMLKRSPAARQLFDFVKTQQCGEIIKSFGYEYPLNRVK